MNENPDVHDRLTKAFGNDDPKTFAKVVAAHWRKYGIQPPADKCDPYVTVYILTLSQPEPERRCHWLYSISPSTPNPTPKPGGPSFPPASHCPLPDPLPPEPPQNDEVCLQHWISRRLVECKWYGLKIEYDLKRIKKFAAGVCPAGTY
ncbi:MAG TPA: hypothetical protein VJ400_06460 [Thermoplasmata archaeon]|nr:hypothetical protein [Thermoplasmata archaeon]